MVGSHGKHASCDVVHLALLDFIDQCLNLGKGIAGLSAVTHVRLSNLDMSSAIDASGEV